MSNSGTLPEDIVTDILSRLPVKSLCRFKCVSPSWNSLISDPRFAKTHLNQIKTQNPTDLGKKTSLIYTFPNFYSINFADANPTTTKLDFPMVEQHEYQATLWNSCNGLLLVSHQDIFHQNKNLFLLNPANRECKKLPTAPFGLCPDSYSASVCAGVGYDPFTDDYKVVTLYSYNTGMNNKMTNVAVYSGKTNAWRRIQDSHYDIVETSCGLFLNGCIHCRCWKGEYSFTVVAFDISEEIFREVPLPAWLNDFKNDSYNQLNAIGDHLCLVFMQGSGQVEVQFEVWMMEEYGVRESWTRFISITATSSVEEFFFETSLKLSPISFLRPRTFKILYVVLELLT